MGSTLIEQLLPQLGDLFARVAPCLLEREDVGARHTLELAAMPLEQFGVVARHPLGGGRVPHVVPVKPQRIRDLNADVARGRLQTTAFDLADEAPLAERLIEIGL